MSKFRLTATLALLLLAVSPTFGQTAKYSNEFLSLGIGARGLAMSNTMTAIANDVTAAYWNPACLSMSDKKYELALMHAEYFAGIAKYDYGGIAYKIDSTSSVAISYIRFGVDNIMNTTELIDNQGNIDYNRITYFSSADNAILLTYAHNFRQVEGLSVGANVKILRRTIGSFAGSWGFGLDAGLHYVNKGWHVGANLRDATSTSLISAVMCWVTLLSTCVACEIAASRVAVRERWNNSPIATTNTMVAITTILRLRRSANERRI